jgi:RNA polymerase sigma-70 factor, ECF subfamily
MDTTPVSLLQRIQQSGDSVAWRRLVDLTTPLILSWGQRAGLSPHDAADLVQDVLTVLVQELPQFQYDPSKSFRAWLKTVTLNKHRQRMRRHLAGPREQGDATLDDLPDGNPSEAFWEREFGEQLVVRAFEVMQSEFRPTTWRACWESVVSGRSAGEIAAELGITPGAVHSAKSKVLRRLRHELKGMME